MAGGADAPGAAARALKALVIPPTHCAIVRVPASGGARARIDLATLAPTFGKSSPTRCSATPTRHHPANPPTQPHPPIKHPTLAAGLPTASRHAAMDVSDWVPPPGTSSADWVPVYCSLCSQWLRTGEWRRHLRGRRHLHFARRAARAARLAAQQARRAARAARLAAQQEEQAQKRER